MNRAASIVLALATYVSLAATAHAHFALVQPSSWADQGPFGDPQKSEPCGQADPGTPPVPTGSVTTYKAGDLIDISIDEKIFHPGHYRVSLAASQGALPADPVVQAGATACGSTTIEANPTAPLLADGLLVHTTAFSGTQTMHVQLPAGMTCAGCTLQITEFMSNHPLNNPGGCFYHHCAVVNITATGADAGIPDAPSASTDAGSNAGNDAGTNAEASSSGGCCDTGGHGSVATGGLGLVALGFIVVRRRRRGPAS